MCLIVVDWRPPAGGLSDSSLIVAANRDERHARPAQAAHWWPDARDVFAGRDLEAGGTWLGVHRAGRFAAVTNVRGADSARGALSRGALVRDFLRGDRPALEYAAGIDGTRFGGFNLLVADADTLAYVSNRGDSATALPAGRYAIANAGLDETRFKVERSKALLGELIDGGACNESRLMRLLADRERAPAASITATAGDFESAWAGSALFIVGDEYGTRASTVVIRSDARLQFAERSYDAGGASLGERRITVDPVSRAATAGTR